MKPQLMYVYMFNANALWVPAQRMLIYLKAGGKLGVQRYDPDVPPAGDMLGEPEVDERMIQAAIDVLQSENNLNGWYGNSAFDTPVHRLA